MLTITIPYTLGTRGQTPDPPRWDTGRPIGAARIETVEETGPAPGKRRQVGLGDAANLVDAGGARKDQAG